MVLIKVRERFACHTGRQAAPTNIETVSKIFSINEWNNGIAANDIIRFQQNCMKLELFEMANLVIYPTSGFTGYTANFDSGSQNVPDFYGKRNGDACVAIGIRLGE